MTKQLPPGAKGVVMTPNSFRIEFTLGAERLYMQGSAFGVKYREPRNVQAAQVERAALKRELHAPKYDPKKRKTVWHGLGAKVPPFAPGKPTWQHRPRKTKLARINELIHDQEKLRATSPEELRALFKPGKSWKGKKT
jgi:hypothetical protein